MNRNVSHARSCRYRDEYPLAFEGESGFSQCWYPVATSSEVPDGGVFGTDFLDGRVVVYRGEDQVARVVSAYCPHMGADLAEGDVVGNEVRCAFHHWQFNGEGQCMRTGVGDPPPAGARLFSFPTVEHYGLIWAFNGNEPLYELPKISPPGDKPMIYHARRESVCNADPGSVLTNALDFQHIRAVHGWVLDHADPVDHVQWKDYLVSYHMTGHVEESGVPFDFDINVWGANCAIQNGTFDGMWTATISALTILRPGLVQSMMVTFVGDGNATRESEQAARRLLNESSTFHTTEAAKDFTVLNSSHFVKGTLTRGDVALARMIDHFRAYPRAHPSANYIS